MKTRAQKEAELAEARVLFDKSQALIFADFSSITAEGLRKLRTEMKKSGANFLVVKKRVLGILLKEKGIDVDLSQYKTSVGTIFSEADTEHIAGPAYKFFAGMEVPEGGAKDMWTKKILTGYDLKANGAVAAEQLIYIGKLPPREVVLGQFLGMLAAPVRAFLYILQQKAEQGGTSAPAPAEKAAEAAPVAEAAPAAEAAAPEASAEQKPNDDSNPDEKVELTQAQ